ncbi:glycosyltransferase [Streptomyces sp. NPDC012623]|uniref:glycosyltransferase n=1 Tax=unclassified Streptomyces TaxID=2593676 RepID=UPI0036908846
MTALQVSVVVPCFNEAEVIETFHAALLQAMEPTRQTFEICYVDDGSGDRTRELLSRLAAADGRVRYLAFSRNFGKEAAMLAGLRMSAGGAVILMDADLQHPPELLPRMIELHRHGYDQVIARRDRTGEGALRSVLSRTYYRVVRHCVDVEVIDGSGDFRLLSRRAVDSVLALPESNRFSKGIFSWIGFDTIGFTYRSRERAAGASKWGGRRLLNYGIDGVLSFNSRPLRLAIHAGLWFVLSALAYALWIIVDVALNGAAVPGYATLLTAVVALAGIQLATLGVVGEYVGRIYHETKHRPHYVVRETEASRPSLPLRPVTPRLGGLRALGAGRARGGAFRRRRTPARTRTLRQFAFFVSVGFVNTAVYLLVYASLNTSVPYLAAHCLGYLVSVVVSFFLNTYITCRTRPTWRAFLRYPLSSVFNLVAAGGLLYLGVSALGMDKNLAAVAAGVLVTPFSFLLARWAITSGALAAAPAAGAAPDRPVQPADESDAV